MKGGCLCGTVRYEVDTFQPDLANCHCSMCRKISGSAFGVFGSVRRGDFRWLIGVDAIREYVSSEIAKRGFCGKCGSNLYYRLLRDDAGYEIALGTLDDEPDQQVNANIWFASKAGWVRRFDDLPSYEKGRSSPLMRRPG